MKIINWDAVPYWVRWVLLLPVSFVIYVFCFLILRGVLDRFAEGYMGEGAYYENVESIPFMHIIDECLGLLAGAYSFMWSANKIAPFYKQRIILSIGLILMCFTFWKAVSYLIGHKYFTGCGYVLSTGLTYVVYLAFKWDYNYTEENIS